MPDFNRPPRIQPELPQGEVEIPAPPTREGGRQSLVQLALPLITIAGYLIVSGTRGGGASQLLFILPMALSMVASTTVAVFNFFRDARINRERQAAYQQLLGEKRREMEATHDQVRNFYLYNYPDPEEVIRMASGGQVDSRLWERRSTDLDFGSIRLGKGTIPSPVIYKFTQSGDTET
ncbi:MAG TPA: hypothetical protein VMT34_09015, partial [Aggregatilineales bacterium]|nr:hypothetical protein [Aggregatilineales bacterium]